MPRHSEPNLTALDSRDPRNARMSGLDASEPSSRLHFVIVLPGGVSRASHGPEMDLGNGL